MLIKLVFSTILLVTTNHLLCQAGEDDVAPLCKICSCEGDRDSGYLVTCAGNLKGDLILQDSSWVFQNGTNSTNSYNYKNVTIRDVALASLEVPFASSGLKYLSLVKCMISHIDDSIFKNLQDMEVLILSDNNVEIIDPNAFKGIYQPGDFTPLQSLKILRLDHNKIHSLDQDIFEHTSRIETLDLSHNPFKILDQHTTIAITSLVYLKNLDLSFTQIKELPDHFMHTPKFLQLLDLSGNEFEEIPKTLGESHNLTVLYINENPIENLTLDNGFPSIPTLKVLHMRNMPKLRAVQGGSLSKLEGLEELYMFGNPELSFLHKAALSLRKNESEYETWPPLTKLYLQDNKLVSIDLHFYPRWNTLNELDLTDNPWTCECENQWMVDELMPMYLKINKDLAKEMMCAAPIEMQQFTLFDVYSKQTTMRCLDVYGHRPERDGALLVGILAGLLIAIPLVLFILYSYQRNWFGVFDRSAAGFSRQFYRRPQASDEFF